jgi:hypothetical protein
VKLLVSILFVISASLRADTPPGEYPYIKTGLGGGIYFRMIPRHNDDVRRNDGYGIAYRVKKDGSDQELWRTEGWYSPEVFLANDERSLVAMGPWNWGDTPKKEDTAVSFYRDGKLLKRYSTADLVKDPSKVFKSVSHYQWLARSAGEKPAMWTDPEAQLHISGSMFYLKTCDGILYEFELTTGNINSQRQT